MPWLEREFGWSDETARKYMRVAEAFQIPTRLEFGSITIDASALYALSGPNVPQSARDEAVERAEAGERITRADADKLIAEAERDMKAMLRDAIATERERSAAVEKTAIEAATRTLSADRAALQAEIERIKAAHAAPGVPEAVDMFCKILGRPKLNGSQMQLVAQLLETPITDGKRVYPPVTEEVSRQKGGTRSKLSAVANRAF